MNTNSLHPLPGQQVIHVAQDLDTDLEQLFNSVMNPKPSSWRKKLLPESFFKEPESGSHSRQSSTDSGSLPPRLTVQHVRSHSSPASLQLGTGASATPSPTQHAHLRQQSFDVADELQLPPGWEMAFTPSGQRYFLNVSADSSNTALCFRADPLKCSKGYIHGWTLLSAGAVLSVFMYEGLMMNHHHQQQQQQQQMTSNPPVSQQNLPPSNAQAGMINLPNALTAQQQLQQKMRLQRIQLERERIRMRQEELMRQMLSSVLVALIGLAGSGYCFIISALALQEGPYCMTGTTWEYPFTNGNGGHAATFLQRGADRIGSVYKKAVYKQYTNSSYREEVIKPNWMGYLGPLIAAEEGDTIIIHLKNFASRPYSLHSHGVKYTKEHEGAFYPDNTSKNQKNDDHVYPGQNYTYVWEVSAQHAPAKDDTNCLTRVYHSHVDGPKDVASGLVGPLITCKKGSLDIYGDSEADYIYTLLFTVADENLSWYLDENIKTYCSAPPGTVDKDNEDFQESNKMHSINGFVYGNLPGLLMCAGSKIHWHLLGMGNEVDIHSVYFSGQMLTDRTHHVDTISLFPATFVNAVMVPHNLGKWLLSCQVNDHVQAGMQAFFEVKTCFPPVHRARPRGAQRQYYIAAEEVIWDYGPSGINHFSGDSLTTDSDSQPFFEKGPHRIGGKYKKAVYTEYTDETFTTRKQRTEEERHLGLLGPVIKAEVGDTIHVTFLNKATHPFSIQPHGVEFNKYNEGAFYNSIPGGHVTPSSASHVLPGSNFTYEWTVPEDGGPVSDDPDCLNWLYYSAVDSVKDTSSGLVGPLLVCRRGSLRSGKQKNVDKEFHLLATVSDENLSWYLEDNIKMFAGKPGEVNVDDEDFQESNKMHSVEMEWDYSPNRTWEDEMHQFNEESPGNAFISKEDKFIGSKYKKVVYREYSDATFTTPKERGEDEEHLGILGPIIHANVGDKVKIVFKNMANRPYSIHAHGVKTDSAKIHKTEPGETHTYTWSIPKRSGPSQGDSECTVWAYFSTEDTVKDMYSGLIGPLVTCKKSILRMVGLKKQLQEFVLLFLVFDENESWYLDENIKAYVSNPQKVIKDDEDFIESNKMHEMAGYLFAAINGKMFGNLHGLTMHVGEKVYWYLMGMGNEVDIHTAHFHGHSFDYKLSGTHRADVFDLFPATFQTVEMQPLYPGTWLLHCHVTDHMHAGMETTYTVLEKEGESGNREAFCTIVAMQHHGLFRINVLLTMFSCAVYFIVVLFYNKYIL
ncbi:Ceruloplasmin [Acipenser ruthenus]|uniref:Ceruloplasmin n=1 Tax=Acipenser ruthenus TaxID=7906 RepID=A0A444U2S8_ACIRT|nr:Ceruloplasmin [Acipenser ruthenus]